MIDGGHPLRLGKALVGATDVVEAHDGARALTLLSTGSPFDLVLLDSGMSRTRPGYPACVELVRKIFHRWPWLPVIVIGDGRRLGRLIADLLLSGVRQVLPRGVATAVLARSVARAGRRPGARLPAVRNIAAIKRSFVSLDEPAAGVPTLRELAVTANMSRSHFSRTFHAVAGMSLRDYVRDVRLKRAHALLADSTLSLTDVAVEAGFYDLPHFDKAFRQRLGRSPYEFRGRYAHCEVEP
jgi:AraC-like DNA-binding protein